MLASRIIDKISPEPVSGCWIWTASLNRAGYGRLKLEGVSMLAHRAIFELVRGQIPRGLVLDHLCRVPCCVNPYHLDPVTQGENLRRSPITPDNIRASHRAKSARTHCDKGHEYSPSNVKVDKAGGWRICIACDRQRRRAFYHRHRKEILAEQRFRRERAREVSNCLR